MRGFGRVELIRAGGGETAWKDRSEFGCSVGGSVTDGRLRGVPLILLMEFPDCFVSPETLREWGLPDSVSLEPSSLRKSDGREIAGKPFLKAMSLAEDSDVCCEIGRGTWVES